MKNRPRTQQTYNCRLLAVPTVGTTIQLDRYGRPIVGWDGNFVAPGNRDLARPDWPVGRVTAVADWDRKLAGLVGWRVTIEIAR